MKKIIKIVLVLVLLTIITLVYLNYPRLNIVSGYSAKIMSSSVFMAHRSYLFTEENDNNFSPVALAKDELDTIEKTATASVYGLVKRTAMYRDGVGSVLLIDDEAVNN